MQAFTLATWRVIRRATCVEECEQSVQECIRASQWNRLHWDTFRHDVTSLLTRTKYRRCSEHADFARVSECVHTKTHVAPQIAPQMLSDLRVLVLKQYYFSCPTVFFYNFFPGFLQCTSRSCILHFVTRVFSPNYSHHFWKNVHITSTCFAVGLSVQLHNLFLLDLISYSTVALVPPMSTMYVWRGIT